VWVGGGLGGGGMVCVVKGREQGQSRPGQGRELAGGGAGLRVRRGGGSTGGKQSAQQPLTRVGAGALGGGACSAAAARQAATATPSRPSATCSGADMARSRRSTASCTVSSAVQRHSTRQGSRAKVTADVAANPLLPETNEGGSSQEPGRPRTGWQNVQAGCAAAAAQLLPRTGQAQARAEGAGEGHQVGALLGVGRAHGLQAQAVSLLEELDRRKGLHNPAGGGGTWRVE
jgi:hypothetical protein